MLTKECLYESNNLLRLFVVLCSVCLVICPDNSYGDVLPKNIRVYLNGGEFNVGPDSQYFQELLKQVDALKAIQIPDKTPPTITNLFPPPNSVDLPPDTKISFEIQDDISGVDLSSVDVSVFGIPVVHKGSIESENYYKTSITDNGDSYSIFIEHKDYFFFDREIYSWIEFSDCSGNKLNMEDYIFTTVKGLDDFIIEPRGITTNEPTTVTFKASIMLGVSPIASSAYLQKYDKHRKPIGKPIAIYNDGTNGDKQAGDNIYTTQIVLNEPEPTINYFKFFVTCTGNPASVESDFVDVSAQTPINWEEFVEIGKINKTANANLDSWGRQFGAKKATEMLTDYFTKQTHIVSRVEKDPKYNRVHVFYTNGMKGEFMVKGRTYSTPLDKDHILAMRKKEKELVAIAKKDSLLSFKEEKVAELKQGKAIEIIYSTPQEFQISSTGKTKKTLTVNHLLIPLEDGFWSRGTVLWGKDYYISGPSSIAEARKIIGEINKITSEYLESFER